MMAMTSLLRDLLAMTTTKDDDHEDGYGSNDQKDDYDVFESI